MFSKTIIEAIVVGLFGFWLAFLLTQTSIPLNPFVVWLLAILAFVAKDIVYLKRHWKDKDKKSQKIRLLKIGQLALLIIFLLLGLFIEGWSIFAGDN